MNKIVQSCAALTAAMLVMNGCGGSNGTSSLAGAIGLDQPRVRAINAFSGVGFMTGQAGSDSFLNSSIPIPYSVVGPYIISRNESETVSFFDEASNLLASVGNILFRINNYYTVVGYGTSSNRQIALIEDTHHTASSGRANLRFLNAITTVGPVDVYVTEVGASLPSVPTASFLAVGKATTSPDYSGVSVPVGGSTQIEVRVTPAGNRNSILLDINPLRLADEDRWTIVFNDPSPSTGQSSIGYVKAQDRP